jgi:SPP1 gp7 family putative phage head morphogenesis protein
MQKKLAAALNEQDLQEAKKAEIANVLAKCEKVITDAYGGIQQSFDLGDYAKTVSDNTGKSLVVALGKEASGLPTSDYFKSLASDVLLNGAPIKDWWQAQSDDFTFKFSSAVRQGLANGETNSQITQRLTGTKTEPGLIDVAEKNARTLVQTSAQCVANNARLATFKANSDIIKGIVWVATLDGHTCEQCMAYSGAQYDLDGQPLNDAPTINGGPPLHFNCRCVMVPLTKSFKELGVDADEPPVGTRASEDGQLLADTSFSDFLSTKTEDYQNEMLGKGRADMWRDGKITLRDLVAGTGRPLTLEELKSRFSD